jgi:hypothetical protein
VRDVIRDAAYDVFPHWWQRKVVWFWDDNLTINRNYIHALLTELKPLKKWWLTQASMDIAKDDKLLDMMRDSGCIGVFLGIESFDKESLADAHKRQNKIGNYKTAVAAIHKRGIAVMAGFIAGFDHDTRESIEEMADRIMEIGITVGSNNGTDITSTWEYDFASDLWTAKSSFQGTPRSGAVSFTLNGTVPATAGVATTRGFVATGLNQGNTGGFSDCYEFFPNQAYSKN